MQLKEYESRRDFERTREPRAGGGEGGGEAGPIFAVQEHDASTLHYDFRLESDGVLLSWAVPKGPSLDPAQRRLAIMVEDHPVTYADFEGVIPEGEYGGGTVLLWDRGVYEPRTPLTEGLGEGQLEFELRGEKLRGAWALIRVDGEGGKNWLLVKMRDDAADRDRDILADRPESVLSGRTLEEIAEEEGEGA